MDSIPSQLTEIYKKYETWHKTRMTYIQAFQYHKTRYDNGFIHPYIDDTGEVVGYYERYFSGNTCILYNVWIKEDCRRGKVFKELYNHFFKNMPQNITEIIGEKVKLGGKFQKAIIRRKDGKF